MYQQQPPPYAAQAPPYGGQAAPPYMAPTQPTQPAYSPYQHPPPPVNNNNMMVNNTTVMGTAMAPVGGTTIVRTHRSDDCCSGEYPGYNDSAGKTTGLVMLVCGILTIIFISVSLAVTDYHGQGGIGSSLAAAVIFYVPTGLLGMCTASKSACVVIAFITMCVLTAFESFAMIIYESVAAGLLSYDRECYYVIYCIYELNTVVMIMHALCALLAVFVFICSISGSILGCMSMNTHVGPSATTVVHTGVPMTHATPIPTGGNAYGGIQPAPRPAGYY